MKDREFLLLVCLVSLTLIFSNFSRFLKSIASTSFLQPPIKQAAQQLKPEGFRQTEQAFWNSLKEVNLDRLSLPTEVTTLKSVTVSSQPKPLPAPTPQVVKAAVSSPPKTPVSPTPPQPTPKVEKPYTRFLFIGDSIMFDLGIKLQSSLSKFYQISNTKLDYKASSGLNRIDYYDWYNRTTVLLDSYKPDVIVVLFGGNDSQNITDINGGYQKIFTKEWEKAYQERVERYAKLLSASDVRKVYWVGQPMSRKSRSNQFFSIFNKIYRDVSKSHPKIKYISTWETFASEGKYATVVADKSGKRRAVKTKDGIHFTSHGANIISDVVLEEMKKDKIISLKSQTPKPPSPQPKSTPSPVLKSP